MANKECTKCGGEFTWKLPYDGTKNGCGDKPCTCTQKTKPREPDYSKPIKDNIDEFEILWNKVYQRLSPLAARISPQGADAKDKHICLCGILHDYFNSLK